MRKKINSRSLEIEDLFLEGFLQKQKNKEELKERKIEFPLRQTTFWVFSLLGVGMFLFLLGMTFFLQVVKGKEFKELSLKNQFLNLQIKTERGVMFDRNMKQIVFNDVRFDLILFSDEFFKENSPEKQKQILEMLSKALNLSEEEIWQKIKTKNSFENEIILKENLSHPELVFLYSIITNFPGIKIKKIATRSYVKEESLSHVLGYLSEISKKELQELSRENYQMGEFIGREGLERTYENVLVEKKGILEIERDALGREISRRIKENPCSGSSIVLTIDLDLQKKASSALKKVIENGEGEAGAVVILDPNSGEVLASVSLPGFDNNVFAKGVKKEFLEKLNQDPRHPQLNRVIGGVYPVGSTIKPLLALAALEEKVITEKTKIFCPLKLCLENKYSKKLECFSDWKFHGWSDVKRAIAESINPFFYIIGGGYEKPKFHSVDQRLPDHFKGLGVEKIVEWLLSFGWGQKTGIDLPGEVAGRVPSPEWKEEFFKEKSNTLQKWYLGDTYNLSIGQGYILITPLQVATAFQAIANFGTIYRPHFLKKVIPNPECPKPQNPTSKNFVLKRLKAHKENIAVVREGMRQTVASVYGSAHYLNDLPVKVAAKTGTAQTSRKEVYHNWITIFAPYDNPQIVMTVLVENVKGMKVVAQKIAKEILQWYFSNPRE